jgi:hypothetical protein
MAPLFVLKPYWLTFPTSTAVPTKTILAEFINFPRRSGSARSVPSGSGSFPTNRPGFGAKERTGRSFHFSLTMPEPLGGRGHTTTW